MGSNLIGTRLGKYEIQAEIGRGGMGTVYKGYDPGLDRYVAVKVLAPHLVWEQEFVERFLREARAAARLKHANVVTIHDVGQEAGWYYFVMEYLEGQTLTEVIQERGPLPPDEVLSILRPLADALDYAHHRGLVHRDVKPGNVIVSPAGPATLTDFGIARAARETRLTRTGTIVGTPEYMSPEQAKGLAVNARSDQYSLAVAAYEMLSGRVPFEAESTLALLHKIVYDPLPPICQVKPDLPAGVEPVMKKALAKEPGDRYEKMSAFADALGRALAGEEAVKKPTLVMEPEAVVVPERVMVATPEPKQAAPPAPEPGRTKVLPDAQPVAPSRRRVPAWAWALGGVAMLVVVVVGVVVGVMMAVGGRKQPTIVVEVTATPAEAVVVEQPIDVLQLTATPAPEYETVPTVASPFEGSNIVYYYGFNATLPPFDDPLVRQAFILALDRAVLAGLANTLRPESYYEPATTFTPPGVLRLDLYGEVGLSYAPWYARGSLAQAGYPDGSGLPAITLWYNETESEFHRHIAEAVQEQWQEILGVEVNLASKPWDEYLDMLYSDPPQVWRLGWVADYVDPHNFLYDAICSTPNDDWSEDEYAALEAIANAPDETTRRERIEEFSGHTCTAWSPTSFLWDNADYAHLLSRALQELDEERRRELYVQAEQILCETDAVVIPLFHYHVGE